MRYTFSHIAATCTYKSAQIPLPVADVEVLLTDSRKLGKPSETLFFCLKTTANDGHKYIAELSLKGVNSFIIDDISFDISTYPHCNFLLVDNVLEALQAIATAHRLRFNNIPIIAITGSNGKTIVKEWLSGAVGSDYWACKSPQSYNSQIGVPLSVWQLTEGHTLGIFEAGISQPHEMEKLATIIKPTIGVFTTLGSAHSENFGNPLDILHEKFKLFNNADNVIYCQQQPEVSAYVAGMASDTNHNKYLGWYASPTGIDAETHLSTYTFGFRGKEYNFSLNFEDAASVENAFSCAAAMLLLGLSVTIVKQKLLAFSVVPMRLELKQGINNNYIIDDSYNNDWAGFQIALDNLNQKNNTVKSGKVVILSDFEAERKSEQLYTQLVAALKQYNVDTFIGIGNNYLNFKHLFDGLDTRWFPNTESVVTALPVLQLENKLILIKGSRSAALENVVAALQVKTHITRLEVNLNGIATNLRNYKSTLAPKTKIMAMVKAFAYGSGSYEVANILQYGRADYLAVAYADEGADLRKNGITLPIMVMNPAVDTFPLLLFYNLEPVIYSFGLLKAFTSYLKNTNTTDVVSIHVEYDTGMNRLGFRPSETPLLAQSLQKSQCEVKVVSAFSHLAAADEAQEDNFSRQQITDFSNAANELNAILGYDFLKHICNSAGIVRFPDAHFDMVRLGIGLYGVSASDGSPVPLMHVATLKSSISQIRTLAKDETIGYGRRGKLKEGNRVGIIAIGYADGFSRSFSNGKGKVKILNKWAAIVGNVCMDMCMVDLTNIPEAQEGTEVILFDEDLTLNYQAKAINTIPYEMLSGISGRVKRVYIAA